MSSTRYVSQQCVVAGITHPRSPACSTSTASSTPPSSTPTTMVREASRCGCHLDTTPPGFLPQTYCDDEDPLDVLVLMQESVAPMSFLRAKPIGMMRMLDNGQQVWAIWTPFPCAFSHLFTTCHTFSRIPGRQGDCSACRRPRIPRVQRYLAAPSTQVCIWHVGASVCIQHALSHTQRAGCWRFAAFSKTTKRTKTSRCWWRTLWGQSQPRRPSSRCVA